MNRFLAFLLLVAIAAQTFWNLGVAAYWLGNREYIAANLCENRDRPASCCAGKCYLEKRLADAPNAPAEDGGSSKIEFKKGIDLAETPAFSPFLLEKVPDPARSVLNPRCPVLLDRLREKGLFRPPKKGASQPSQTSRGSVLR